MKSLLKKAKPPEDEHNKQDRISRKQRVDDYAAHKDSKNKI